ncbi:MAG TPA: HesA/MoeB/ThiF family protein [Methylomirabilota bacterium]|nr:HesA/MoeB/ThiF family protein [Methylomirabilota bacterium]
MDTRLSSDQIERYSRQIMVPDLGGKAQIRLRQSKVLVIGAGGLGSPAALYLAAAGVGALGIIDPDKVELSNLQRQILHATPDIGRHKVESAKSQLAALNPDVEITAYVARFEANNAAEIAAGYDFIIDGSDNFDTKFLVNDVAIQLGIAFSHAGIVRLQGQTMTVIPGKTACYRCLFQAPPPLEEILNCQASGVLGAVAGTIGTIQATEAIKYLAGFEEGLLTDRLLVYDAKSMKFRDVSVARNPECASCGAEKKSGASRFADGCASGELKSP